MTITNEEYTMSEQQFQEQEEPRGYQPVYTTAMKGDDFAYRDRYEEPGQKVYPQLSPASPTAHPSTISAGQRLALAIVSVSILVPILAILITAGISDQQAGNLFILAGRLVALALVCLTIMVVNYVFNRHR